MLRQDSWNTHHCNEHPQVHSFCWGLHWPGRRPDDIPRKSSLHARRIGRHDCCAGKIKNCKLQSSNCKMQLKRSSEDRELFCKERTMVQSPCRSYACSSIFNLQFELGNL